MEAHINDEISSKYNLTIQEVFLLLGIACVPEDTFKNLIDKGYISLINSNNPTSLYSYKLTAEIKVILDIILTDSNKNIQAKEDDIQILAKTIREIYPSGTMQGTSYYYRSNLGDITRKLKSFYKKYGLHYTNKQIIEATTNYVNSFNGNYQYMKLLKYFIWKEEKKDGEIVSSSLLADWLENDNSTISKEWITDLK